MAARTLPPMPVFLAGQKLTGTLMNQLGAYSQFLASPPMFRMHQTALQSVANSTWTQITMDVSDYDTDSGRAGGTPWSYTIPAGMGGRWRFSLHVGFTTNATGARLGAVYKNGVVVTDSSESTPAQSSTAQQVFLATTLLVNAGDVMSVWGWQGSGGALNTDTTTASWFEGELRSLASP